MADVSRLMAGEQSLHLRSRLHALGLDGVLEQSVKLSTRSFKKDRYVIGIAAEAVSGRQLSEVIAYFNPPYSVAEAVMQRHSEASTLGFGQDGNWEEGFKRLYIEYWHRLETDVVACLADHESVEKAPRLTVGVKRVPGVHVMDAWKWQASRIGEWYRSRYHVFPGLSREESSAVFVNHVQQSLASVELAAALRNVLFGMTGHPNPKACAQLWATWDIDQNNLKLARQTLDLNILDFDIPVDCLYRISSEISAAFPAVADHWQQWLKHASATDAVISHIAAGIDKGGERYCCVYYLVGQG